MEGFHTYYVSEQDVLVHNTCVQPAKIETTSQYWKTATYFKGNKVYQRDDLFEVNYVENGITNLDRMKKGYAPIGNDGRPIQLHHMTQMQDGAIAEVTQNMHQKYNKILHINSRDIPSGINRNEFNQWRRNYWKNRAKDYVVG